MSRDALFTEDDRRELAARGIPESEARRQLALMERPPAFAELVRPCVVGDGIERLDEGVLPALLEAHARAARAGAVSVFVPASGAATRMFKDLLAALGTGTPLEPGAVRAAAAGEAWAGVVAECVDGLPRFAFHDALASALAAGGHSLEELRAHGPWRPLLEALLGPGGLDYARLPKGLLEFHRGPDGPRTAFAEHLAEACELAGDGRGRCRAHFTVSPEHRARFEALLARVGAALGGRSGATFDVVFSEQHPDTDTLAGDPDGGPFRDAAGRLLFRPAGHGALLRNLEETGGELVFVKNVDNVAAERLRAESLRWARALVGFLVGLREQVAGLREGLADGRDAAAGERARAFALARFGRDDAPAEREALAAWLDRPLRVCGMVRNTGEPGGGPFWVRDARGRVTKQIVESAQVDPRSSEQAAVLAQATHFNPVFFACALRAGAGRPHRLADYVDAASVIVTRKSAEGRELLALERPGLWNGAMADWLTVFVEVPLAVFNPVKTVLDLLRPEHQP